MELQVFQVVNWRFFLFLTLLLLAMFVVLHIFGFWYVKKNPGVNRRFLDTFMVFEALLVIVAFIFGAKLYFETPAISPKITPSTHVWATDRILLSEWSQAKYSGHLDINDVSGATSLVKNDGTVIDNCHVVYFGSPIMNSNGSLTLPASLFCNGEELDSDINQEVLEFLKNKN